jgi:hypothetical protein
MIIAHLPLRLVVQSTAKRFLGDYGGAAADGSNALKIDPTSDAALELTGGVAKAIADAERAASAAELDLLAEVETKQLPSRSGGTSKKKSSKKSKKTNALAALSASSSTNEAPTKKEIAIAAATASTIEEVKEESTLRTSADSVDLVCIGDLLCTHMI